jgi:hypothetical protein
MFTRPPISRWHRFIMLSHTYPKTPLQSHPSARRPRPAERLHLRVRVGRTRRGLCFSKQGMPSVMLSAGRFSILMWHVTTTQCDYPSVVPPSVAVKRVVGCFSGGTGRCLARTAQDVALFSIADGCSDDGWKPFWEGRGSDHVYRFGSSMMMARHQKVGRKKAS